MKNIIIFLACFLLSGCAMPQYTKDLEVTADNSGRNTLKRITITRFGTTRFTGLIAFAQGEAGLQFTLLDPTGVTLLSASCDTDGDVMVQGGIPKITRSSLPRMLAESLLRIYLYQPAGTPCSASLLSSFCLKATSTCETAKYLRNGPFLSWKVCYTDDKSGTIIYTRPLAWFTLTLADVAQTQK